jgi:hypothetical protein
VRAGRFAPGPTLPELPAPKAPATTLVERFVDLRRHLIFEYYPWYATDPYRHWEQWDRNPPEDIAATCLPLLGAYESLSWPVLEAHARWIAGSGAGAVNLSWWGRDSFEDRAVHLVMDVFRDHDIKVTFHLEPYALDRHRRLTDDILHLLREFGERRGWDALLLLRDESGREGPLFKTFRTILPEAYVDCHGVRQQVADYTPDEAWRRQTDLVRLALSHEFDHVTLLADSLDFERTRAAGFDGIAIYDNFVPPEAYRAQAAGASAEGLVFTFNANPGFDGIEPRVIEPGACYEPTPFAPGPEAIDWSTEAGREQAAARSVERIRHSFEAALAVQSDPELLNARRGFLLLYINSFNEWHEGTAFEPMRDAADLTPQQRSLGYHNPRRGDYRLEVLRPLLREVSTPRPGMALPTPLDGVVSPVAPSRAIGYVSAREVSCLL